MKEEFIAYLWKHRLLRGYPMKTICGNPIEIISPGQENINSGPDFIAAVVRIDGTIWAGNVEIHVQSSHWFLHKHHNDQAYMNIILHVIYLCDKVITDNHGKPIPHLEIKKYYNHGLELNYSKLVRSRTWIACQKLLGVTDPFILKHWLYRLLVIRLERKSQEIQHYLKYFDDHLEKTMLFMISRSLGGKTNETAFGLLIQRTPYGVIIRNHDKLLTLEALLFGQAGLLNRKFSEQYPKALQHEYRYLRKKYEMPDPLRAETWKYAKMRPVNFPDLRIAQLAMIIHKNQAKLYNRMLNEQLVESICNFLNVDQSDYWTTHYRLDKTSVQSGKKLGIDTIQSIIINALVPMVFLHARKSAGMQNSDRAVHMLEQIHPENNKIIRMWLRIFPKSCSNAALSQGFLELYKNYCLPKKCLKCMIGHHVLKGNVNSGINSQMTSA